MYIWKNSLHPSSSSSSLRAIPKKVTRKVLSTLLQSLYLVSGATALLEEAKLQWIACLRAQMQRHMTLLVRSTRKQTRRQVDCTVPHLFYLWAAVTERMSEWWDFSPFSALCSRSPLFLSVLDSLITRCKEKSVWFPKRRKSPFI